tara:strand:- start:8863 stop:9054 length:192 start_codon:yes stop_codon:yes gene_type:complete
MKNHYVSERYDYINEMVEAAEEMDKEMKIKEEENVKSEKEEKEYIKVEVVDDPKKLRRGCIIG